MKKIWIGWMLMDGDEPTGACGSEHGYRTDFIEFFVSPKLAKGYANSYERIVKVKVEIIKEYSKKQFRKQAVEEKCMK